MFLGGGFEGELVVEDETGVFDTEGLFVRFDERLEGCGVLFLGRCGCGGR